MRSTARGLIQGVYITVKRVDPTTGHARHRDAGWICGPLIEDPKHGIRVPYRSKRNGGQYTAALADVRIDRELQKRARARITQVVTGSEPRPTVKRQILPILADVSKAAAAAKEKRRLRTTTALKPSAQTKKKSAKIARERAV